MKVALVHDFLTEYGGAERVLEVLHEIWPKAPVYTAFYNPKSLGPNAEKFVDWKIITSWGTKLPFWQKLISPYRIFSKSFFERFDLSDFDLVLSSSNAYMAKAVKVPNGVHICYCHTPPRFLYGYPTALNWRKNIFLRAVGEVINHFMRVWDFETAHQVDYFITNSKEVQGRIKKFYRRDSQVIYPPTDVNRFSLIVNRKKKTSSDERSTMNDYFLVVSRLVASKKVEIVVEVCAKLGLPLKVVGGGKELESLKRLAESVILSDREGSKQEDSDKDSSSLTQNKRAYSSKTQNDNRERVEFLGEVPDEELIELYRNCRAVIFPAQIEDFGLVPVEAMAAGKPVIALAEGGVLETVIDAIPAGKGKGTGVYFSPATAGSLTLAINNFEELEKKGYFDPKFIQKHAQKFSKERFKKEILKFVESKLK